MMLLQIFHYMTFAMEVRRISYLLEEKYERQSDFISPVIFSYLNK